MSENSEVPKTSGARWEFGLWAVLIGVTGVVISFVVVALNWNDSTGIAALGVIVSPIAAIVSAYFGIQYGQKVAAEAAEVTAAAAVQVERAKVGEEAAVEKLRSEIVPALEQAATTEQMSPDAASGFAVRAWDQARSTLHR